MALFDPVVVDEHVKKVVVGRATPLSPGDLDPLPGFGEPREVKVVAPHPIDERIEGAFQQALGHLLFERVQEAQLNEDTIGIADIDLDMLRRFFRDGWNARHAFETETFKYQGPG